MNSLILLALKYLLKDKHLDDLTKAYNSEFLRDYLDKINKNQQVSILFIDIDKFKSVNDNHGHITGSKILQTVVQIIKDNIRRSDMLFRYGGDEFVVVLNNTDQTQLISERLRTVIEKQLFEKDIHLTISIGVADFPTHAKTGQEVIHLADMAMYDSKRNGRNKITYY
jgi:diguanylate cyclase (GGDEF)-like protein